MSLGHFQEAALRQDPRHTAGVVLSEQQILAAAVNEQLQSAADPSGSNGDTVRDS